MSEAPMTREEMAELHGVTPLTVDFWTSQGMPTLGGAAGSGRRGQLASTQPRDWRITRRDFAQMLNTHPDTLTKKLPEGLRAAVVEPGGRGEEMIHDLRLAFRWWLASEGRLNRVVLDDFQACARAGVLAMSQMPVTGLLLQSSGRPGRTAGQPKKTRRGRPNVTAQ